jgi:enoyl-CoA hydratase
VADETRSVVVDGGELRLEVADGGDGVAVLTVDRPGARNAISLATMDALDVALDWASGASVLVIRGGGERAFVSGGDLKDFARLRTHDEATEMAVRMWRRFRRRSSPR